MKLAQSSLPFPHWLSEDIKPIVLQNILPLDFSPCSCIELFSLFLYPLSIFYKLSFIENFWLNGFKLILLDRRNTSRSKIIYFILCHIRRHIISGGPIIHIVEIDHWIRVMILYYHHCMVKGVCLVIRKESLWNYFDVLTLSISPSTIHLMVLTPVDRVCSNY